MQLGLLISVLLHVAILGGALISIQSRPELRVPESEPVAVGMITPGELTKVRQGIRTAKLLEAAEAKDSKGAVAKKHAVRPKVAATAPPPPPPPAPEHKTEPVAPKAAEPPPPPAAAAEAQKKLEAQKKQEAEQRERDRVAAEQKRAEAQKEAEAQRLAEEQKKAEEHKKAEEQKLAEEKRRAEERKRAEEEKQRAEERRRQAELKKKREAEKKRREAALKKKREAERKRHEEEKRRKEAEAAKKKTKSFAELMAEEKALLNKDPRAKSAPPPSWETETAKAKGPTLGDREGKDKQISASELAMIVQTIRTCVTANWTVLSGGASAQETSVKVRLRFNQDGSLSERPRIVNMQQSPYFVAISESAIRAVEQCAPYDLPPDKYAVWKDMVMNFSPRDMY